MIPKHYASVRDRIFHPYLGAVMTSVTAIWVILVNESNVSSPLNLLREILVAKLTRKATIVVDR